MLDMIALAFQTDSTRIATFMYTNEGSNRSYPKIGVRSGHHEIVAPRPESGETGRDQQDQPPPRNPVRSSVGPAGFDSGGRRNAPGPCDDRLRQRHQRRRSPQPQRSADPLGRPRLGTLKPGRHVRYPTDTPLANLYLAMLDHAGVRVPSFADAPADWKD